MGMYNMLFGESELAPMLLGILGLTGGVTRWCLTAIEKTARVSRCMRKRGSFVQSTGGLFINIAR